MADANTHDPTGRTGVRVTTVLQVWGVSYGNPVQLYRGSGLLTLVFNKLNDLHASRGPEDRLGRTASFQAKCTVPELPDHLLGKSSYRNLDSKIWRVDPDSRILVKKQRRARLGRFGSSKAVNEAAWASKGKENHTQKGKEAHEVPSPKLVSLPVMPAAITSMKRAHCWGPLMCGKLTRNRTMLKSGKAQDLYVVAQFCAKDIAVIVCGSANGLIKKSYDVVYHPMSKLKMLRCSVGTAVFSNWMELRRLVFIEKNVGDEDGGWLMGGNRPGTASCAPTTPA
ncbi:hypothetical protein PG984_010713 [Apiospora sp. TS-2023a]